MNLYDIAIAKKLSGGGGGGGGGSSYTLIASTEAEVSTDSTSAIDVTTISLDSSKTANKLIYIKIRDKDGPKSWNFYGVDQFYPVKEGLTSSEYLGTFIYLSGETAGVTSVTLASYQTSNKKGVYASKIYPDKIVIKASYNASYSRVIDGTFSIEVYTLDWPGGENPFEA